jgi:uncharacterized protein YjgD (DUF1641 family)
VRKLTKEEYKEKIIEILDEFLEAYEEITVGELEGVVNKIMAVPFDGEDNNKKVLDRSVE